MNLNSYRDLISASIKAALNIDISIPTMPIHSPIPNYLLVRFLGGVSCVLR